MASRKSKPKPEAELLPDDQIIEGPIKPVKKVVETKTVTYEQPEDEALNENETEFDYDDQPKRKKKTNKEEAEKLREDLAKNGVTPISDLRVYITKFCNENTSEGGMHAEMEDFGKHSITKDALLRGDHMDIARKFGPGRYYFKVYKGNILITHFDGRIGAIPAGFGQIQNGQQFVSMPDPTNPNVTIQMPAQQSLPATDPYKDLERSIKLIKSLKELDGQQAAQTTPPQLSPKAAILEAMAENPKVMESVTDGILKLTGRSRGGGADDVSWATVVRDLIVSEQGPAVVREFVGGIFNGFQGMFGGKQNGQADSQMGTQALPQNAGFQSGQNENPQHSIQAIQEQGNGQAHAGNETALAQSDGISIAPEDALLAFVMDQCKRKVPPKIVARRIIEQADAINQAAPIQSIDGFLELFISLTVDEALAFVASYSDAGKEIAGLDHAKVWTEQLQTELKPAFQEGGQT